jgi:thiol-disulfide isomerase/thioredoxin
MDIKSLVMDRQNLLIIVLAAVILIFSSYVMTGFLTYQPETEETGSGWEITTFTDSGKDIELVGGKPVIRMFSESGSPQCEWAGPTYDGVVKEYVDTGKIVAYHWQLDTNDDILTEGMDGIPESEFAVFYEVSPRESVPTYVFGGKYYRIGNGFERTGDLESEEKEFRAMIEQVLRDAGL